MTNSKNNRKVARHVCNLQRGQSLNAPSYLKSIKSKLVINWKKMGEKVKKQQ